MAETVHTRFHLPDRTYQAIVRAELRKMAESAGFTGHRLGEVEIIIAEITSNLIKHAHKGGILLVRKMEGEQAGIEIISIDNGPGMRMPAKMMEDGRSTKKTLGQGLGAIRRLSGEFDIYSMADWGTILFSRIYVNKAYRVKEEKTFTVNVLAVAKAGETLCGDTWRYIHAGKKIRLVMIDGLGHGLPAYTAAEEAHKMFALAPENTPVDQIRSLNNDLKKTRGAVITVVYLDILNRQIIYSGIGNITMKVISPMKAQGCFSYNGIVGHIMPAVLNNHVLQWDGKNDVIIMHSDGLTARWDIQKYPAILQHHSMLICAALYKDCNRGNDDSTILVGRYIKKT
jgi:anti-sigma regulatory factor (Ser/Thr protein kinase)